MDYKYEWTLPMEIAIPLLGIVASLLTLAFAICLCCASGCCPSLERCRASRRRDVLLRQCRKANFSQTSKCCANETCPICLDDFRERENITVCPCRHGFHRNCILHCLERSPNCPVCKAIVCNVETGERTPLI